MTRVLVTGASGFLGEPVLAALAKTPDLTIHAVARTPGRAGSGVTWHVADLLDHEDAAASVRVARPDVVVHLAWLTEPTTYRDSPVNEAWRAATMAIARAAAEVGTRRILAIGTCAEYDWRTGVLREDSPLRPCSAYAVAKARLHVELHDELDGGPQLCWARPFFLYGRGEHASRLGAAVPRALLAGTPVDVSTGTQRRDYLYVDDAARALAILALGTTTGAINVGSGQATAVRELVAALATAAGRPDLVRYGAITTRHDAALVVADVARLSRETGFAPAVDLAEGARRAVAAIGEPPTASTLPI